MKQTLLELTRTYKLPFVAVDDYQGQHYVILGPDDSSSSQNVFMAKPVAPGVTRAPHDVRAQLLYGGYTRWSYVAQAEISRDITPEEQKRLREDERKKKNESIVNSLLRDKKRKDSMSAPKKPIGGSGQGKVIPFKRKEDK